MFPERRAIAAALVAGGLIAPVSATGGSFELVPEIEVGAVHETNPRYLPDCSATRTLRCGNQYVTGTLVDARLIAAWRTPTTELRLTPRVRDWNFLGDNSDLNNNDQFADISVSHSFQRLRVALDGGYSDTLVRQQVFDEASPEDPNAPPPPDAGAGQVADDGATQQRWRAQPSLIYRLSQRNELQAGIQYLDVKFDDQIGAGFFDYDTSGASLTFAHTIDARNSLLLTINGSTFTAGNGSRAVVGTPEFVNETESYGVSGLYQIAFSETLTGSIQLGTVRNSVAVSVDGQSQFRSASSTLVGNVSVRKRSERTTLNFDVGRSQAPRSDGRTIVRNEARVFAERKLTGRWSAAIGALALDQTGIGDFDRFDQRFYSVDLTARYQLLRNWRMEGTYRVQTNDTASTGILAGDGIITRDFEQSNRRIIVSVIYRGIGYRR